MQSPEEKNPTNYYYFFVNTSSGRGQGKNYLTIRNHFIDATHPQKPSRIFFFDWISQTDRENGLREAKRQSQLSNIYVVMCGGDGSVLWMLNEIRQHQLPISRITFSIIPIGSGNDFSRTLGWGYTPPYFSKSNIEILQNLILKCQSAETVQYDLWDVQISCYNDGKILKVNDKADSQGLKTFKTTFTSYFGIGVDGRIAYTSERNRRKNVHINRLIYSIVGCLCFFNPAPSIDSLLTKLNIQSTKQQSEQIKQSEGEQLDTIHQLNYEQMLESRQQNPSKSSCFLKYEDNRVELKKHWHSLVCINGGSFMAGVRNIWCPDSKKQQKQQKFGDSKLQIVAFRNQLSLALERLINLEQNVCQSNGPFQLQFKQHKKPKKIYIQLDGEPMALIDPYKITIKPSSISKTGKIKVLSNKQN